MARRKPESRVTGDVTHLKANLLPYYQRQMKNTALCIIERVFYAQAVRKIQEKM